MEHPPAHHESGRDGSRRVVALFLAACLLLIGGATAYYVVLIKAPHDLARNVAGGIREAFHVTPRVTIQQTIVIEQNTPIVEVAIVSRDLAIDHSWSHTWLGSTKAMHIQVSYTAKAGFDLRQPFLLTIHRNPLRVLTQLPPARLLSLEMKSYHVVHDEDGWWNRIVDSDRDQVMRDIQEAARRQAMNAGMLEDARNNAEASIRDIVERNGAHVIFEAPGRE
jgi:hypothetical protein